MVRARRVVDEAVARGAVVYGVTTGFGNFADVMIPHDRDRYLAPDIETVAELVREGALADAAASVCGTLG